MGVITVRCGGMMQDVEHVKCGAMSCVKCGAMGNVVGRCINNGQYIRCDLKCGVEYVECGVMWYVRNVKMGCSARRCGVMHDVADMVRFETDVVLQSGIVCCERCWCDRYEMCDMARSDDGVTWNDVRDGVGCRIMQCKMWL